MRLTTKGRYAVTAVMDLAIHESLRPVLLADISERQGISQSYLGRLLADLSRYGLVKSCRGPGGGYTLNRPPEKISLSDVLGAVNENVSTMRCEGKTNCHNDQQCLSHNVWKTLGNKIEQSLSELSLADMISDTEVRCVADRQLIDWKNLRKGSLDKPFDSKTEYRGN